MSTTGIALHTVPGGITVQTTKHVKIFGRWFQYSPIPRRVKRRSTYRPV